MNNRFRRAVRLATGIACACLFIVCSIAIYRLMEQAPSKVTAQRLSVVQAVTGVLSAGAAIVAVALAIGQASIPKRRSQDLLAPRLMRGDKLVDRAVEMGQLVENIRDSCVVNCNGPRGVGKSFLLGHLADVINGHRSPAHRHPRPKGVAAALYFDLADAVGFDEMEAQVCREALGDRTGSWTDFVAYATRAFAHRRVLLILDNVNSPGLWRPLGEAAYRYLASRPHDKVVLGSIEPVRLSNLQVETVPVSGLNQDATGQLAVTSGTVLNKDQLTELYEECSGLPYYISVLAAREREKNSVNPPPLDERIIPKHLPPKTRRLLAYAALIGLFARQISIEELERFPIADLEDHVAVAEDCILLTPLPSTGRRMLKIHDITRDAALRALNPEVAEAALDLFERSHQVGDIERAAIYAMFADPDQIGAARFDELLARVIHGAVKTRNYALLSTLHTRAHESTRILRFISADQTRDDLFCYAHASELAGLGKYTEAENALLSSSIVRRRWDRDDGPASSLQPEMRFLQADITHLRNRYNEAAEMFQELGEWAASIGEVPLHARCVWGQAHVLRHQGRDLERALALFGHATDLAEAAHELFAKVYSVTGATGIKILKGIVPEGEEELLADIETEIAATSSHDGYMLEVWKSQAQVAWLHEQRKSAIAIIEAAIERALTLNDRLLYNLYFEQAEFCRLTGAIRPALDAYRRVLEFGNGNGDRNLISNAMLGMVLVDLSAGSWLHHSSAIDARAATLHARDIALDADIQITAHTAGKVVAMLDSPFTADSESVRLILL